MRVRTSVCRAIVLTSVIWFFAGILVLFYYLDPINNRQAAVGGGRSVRKVRGERRRENTNSSPVDRTVAAASDLLQRWLNRVSFAADGPGAHGKPVRLDKSLEEEEKERFKENQFNVMVSDAISLNRTVPDFRFSKCKSIQYDESSLPKASIIIVFHNEAWSTLLRTLHSVVNRSPKALIEEIILIDDLSDREYLREPLAEYIRRFHVPVILHHLPERSGLIRARLKGSSMSKGGVLLYLDAHVEVSEGWLQPLLERVAGDRRRVAAPIIDVISDETFEYISASDTTWGGYNWQLTFKWYPVSPREMKRRNHDRSTAIQTPTIAGGLFAIDRQFFYDMGTYDEGMQVWGGENLEMSFRMWMCGGILEIVPCSRVGHVFRKQTPYTFPGGTVTIIHTNQARTAEVWMDDHKEFFYKAVPDARKVYVGDLSARKELRVKLGCRSFRWYLKNIYPEAPMPMKYRSLGQIMSPGGKKCVDTMGHSAYDNAGISTCHGMGGNQAWSFTGRGELRSDEMCLAPGGMFSNGLVKLEKCGITDVVAKHVFSYDPENRQLLSSAVNQCLSYDGDQLVLRACDTNAEKQMWILEKFTPSLE